MIVDLTKEEIHAAIALLDRANLRGRQEALALLTIDAKLRQALQPQPEAVIPQTEAASELSPAGEGPAS